MYGKLESLQGTIVKAFLGLSRYSHHSKLRTDLDILPIEESIKSMSVSLMKRIFLVNSPVRSLCSFFMYKYLLTGKYSKSTLFGRLHLTWVYHPFSLHSQHLNIRKSILLETGW